MNFLPPLSRRQFEIPCTVEIEHSSESLHAHVEIDGDFVIEPGDEVLVLDAPTDIPFGGKITERRTAIITRAGALERLWTRWTGDFELTELYDVSFTERRIL